jgi:hypothetical protein
MTTTIKSTELDFDTIKNNLKLFLAQKPEFADYNFEASGISNLLDVLAYNTHYNGLIANFALNESYLSTAQLRSSLVALAGSLGYTVGSKKASYAVVNMYVNDNSNPSTITMPAGFTFSTTVDNVSYTFKTRENLTAVNDGSDRYYFALDGNINVAIYEGIQATKTFIAGPASENETYVIPVTNLDLDTITVRVYDNVSSNSFDNYININNATSIQSTSKIFSIKETPNGFYEVTFANGLGNSGRLGNSPQPGNKIVISYDRVAGSESNGAKTFSPDSTLDGKEVKISTVAIAIGGSEKEELESIRKNAPYLYATQNRMVTAEDYSALILRNFSGVINDIKSWGGEDNLPPQYGSVFVSIDFDTDDTSIQGKTKNDIVALARDLSVASFDVQFVDPVNTFLEISTVFQWNQNLTSQSKTSIESTVKNTMKSFFDANLGSFDQSFRRSNLLTQIDDTDPSILSSRADIKMQYRLVPRSGVSSYTITFPTSIAAPEDDIFIINSDTFFLNGKVCKLRNRLGSNIIEVFNTKTASSEVDNVGYYDITTGVLYLSGFSPSIITGEYIKIVAIPANQATINPLRNNILNYDPNASTTRAVVTNTV